MTAATLTLTEFLLARIAEDERDADSWRRTEAFLAYPTVEGDFLIDPKPWLRVLAECEAKRRIVELHHRVKPLFGGWSCGICLDNGGVDCRTLRALALPYADHPDYRDEWPSVDTTKAPAQPEG